MTPLKPSPGLVIRYAYLWHREAVSGQEEGLKNRPCAIVMTVQGDDGQNIVTVLPITHSRPENLSDGIEIPQATKRRLGLDEQPSWVMLTEANRFAWPGPDLRPAITGDFNSAALGYLPENLFERIRTGLLTKIRERRARLVPRSE